MDVSSTGRLEGSTRIQERPFGHAGEDNKQRGFRRRKEHDAEEDDVMSDAESEGHQLDDLA